MQEKMPAANDPWVAQREAADRDQRRFRVAAIGAVALHLVLLGVRLPQLRATETPQPPKQRVYVLETPRFKLPEVESQRLPERRERRMPMPDETPDEPEPLRSVEPEAFEFAYDDLEVLVLPSEPPPEPRPMGPLHMDAGIERPVPVFTPKPLYTELARRARVQGVVIVQAVIDEQGIVTEAKVLRGLPMGLSESALAAVRQWRFEPALLRGKPVAVYFSLSVNFEIQ